MPTTKRMATGRKALVVVLAMLAGLAMWAVPRQSVALTATADPVSSCVLPAGGFLSEGPTNWNNFPKPVGARKAALLFRGSWDIDAEYGRLKPAEQLYLTSSYGRFQLTLVPNRRPVTLSQEGIASLQRHSSDTGRQGDVVYDNTMATAWGDAARRADPYFDFSEIDIVFLVDKSTSRSYAQFESITLDGKTIKVGAVLGTDWGSHRAKLLAHEGGHTISLPDLYGGPGGHGYIGGWDLMGNLGGHSPDHFAWHKWKLGWLDDHQIRCVATRNTVSDHVLTPVETAGGTKAAVVRYGTSTAYVAEVRTNQGLNTATCDTGVLIYRVDSRVSSGSGPVRVMDSRPSTSCGGNALNDGTYDVGPGEVTTFYDSTNQVRIEVRSKANGTYTVRTTYGTPSSSDFSMSANPSSGSVEPGGSVTSTIGTTITSGNAQSVTLSASDLPAGATASFTPSTIQSGQSSTMRVTTSTATPQGTYRIMVTGQGSASGARSTVFSLVVGQSQPDVVFSDDFESASGWVVNPNDSDTASSGRWERANPESTVYQGVTIQNGTTPGSHNLVTGPLAGADVGTHDVDGGMTSALSPQIVLPGGSSYALSFAYYLAHLDNASAADFLRVRVVTSDGTVSVFTRSGSASVVAGTFQTASIDLSPFAGKTIQLLVEAVDLEGPSLVEAAIDDVKITRQ